MQLKGAERRFVVKKERRLKRPKLLLKLVEIFYVLPITDPIAVSTTICFLKHHQFMVLFYHPIFYILCKLLINC